MENIVLAAIYGTAAGVALLIGWVEGLAIIGASLTVWLVKNEVENRVNAHYRAKYDQEPQAPKQASGL